MKRARSAAGAGDAGLGGPLEAARVIELGGGVACAFAGKWLAGLGAEVLERHAFPDHHPFTRIDAEQLLEAARRLGARPVTTEKDWVRLPEAGAAGALKAAASVLPVEIRMSPSDAGRLEALLAVALKAGS